MTLLGFLVNIYWRILFFLLVLSSWATGTNRQNIYVLNQSLISSVVIEAEFDREKYNSISNNYDRDGTETIW